MSTVQKIFFYIGLFFLLFIFGLAISYISIWYTKDSQTNKIIKKPNFKTCTKIKWSDKNDMKNHEKCNCYFNSLHRIIACYDDDNKKFN